VHYQLADDPEIAALITSPLALLATDHQAHSDAKAVRHVRRIPVETLSGGTFNLAAATGRGQTCCRPTTPRRRTSAARPAGALG